jgi:hypothetical protein
MIQILIEIKENSKKELDIKIYDDAEKNDTVSNFEIETCEDIYDLINYYLNGDEIEEITDKIIFTMRNQKNDKNS